MGDSLEADSALNKFAQRASLYPTGRTFDSPERAWFRNVRQVPWMLAACPGLTSMKWTARRTSLICASLCPRRLYRRCTVRRVVLAAQASGVSWSSEGRDVPLWSTRFLRFSFAAFGRSDTLLLIQFRIAEVLPTLPVGPVGLLSAIGRSRAGRRLLDVPQ